ncbi:hypothetical protein L915_19985 [Phytophthora nicotianae]|uniref:Uncharacterized protein n=1 Tax=Phytophthora nicotianae TaxID=4792 RepID=W2HXA5_PHYNI|nr:hypothetical protein L915_19985 [Phytophthora nicotianae]ETL26476.1 hypothetical protein L916_19866 [Phytophthora nicotianae]
MLDDLQERRTARKQELLIELIRQQKRPEEITMFIKYFNYVLPATIFHLAHTLLK